MPNLSLDVGDAAELAEILQFFCDWLAAEHGGLGASLQRYVGRPAGGITQLRADLDRFTSYSAVATANRCSNHASD